MKKMIALLSSRRFTYALYALGVGLLLVCSGFLKFLILAALIFHFCLHRSIGQKRIRRMGMPLALAALAGILISPQPALALFGFGDLVFDPSSFATLGHIWNEDISTGQKLLQELAQMKRIYDTETQKYQLAMLMAQAIRSKNVFAIQQAIRMGNSYVVDHYGESAAWSRAINLGTSIPIAYQNATLQQQISNTFFATQQIQRSYHLAALARVGITDDINQRVMNAASQINQQQTTNASAVGQWQRSVMSQSQDLNTAVAQQNLTNIGMLHLYEQGRANLTANSLLIQSLMVQNMQQRDTTVSHLNFLQDLQAKQGQTPVVGGFDQATQTHSLY